MKVFLISTAFLVCVLCDVSRVSNMFNILGQGELTPGEYQAMLASKPSKAHYSRGRNVLVRDSDIVLTGRQYNRLYGPRKSNWRKAEKDVRRRWTDNTVPYVIDAGHFSETQTAELHKAMEILSKFTCIRFRPKTDADKNWVKYTDNDSGCNSMLGMMGWGEQSVNLGSGCKWRGLYLHEIGHALGLIHEHQRPDRDSQVKIMWRRVKTDYLSAFTKHRNDSVNNYGIEYDVSSIMHYEPQAFNDNNELTMVPRDSWKVDLMFRVYYKTLSYTDTKVLNLMYKCGERCTNTCSGEAYLDEKCNCVTPKDIHEALCVNEDPDEQCYAQVKEGKCDGSRGAAEMHIRCRKACGSCPTYKMTDYVEPRLSNPYNACVDRYHEPERCRAWAAAGECERSPSWMKRYCRRSCHACSSKLGKCRNFHEGYINDAVCDKIAADGECDDPVKRAGCPDSCDACGYQIPGDCEDDYAACPSSALTGVCDSDNVYQASHIQTICRKSCNSCFMGKGECENEMADHECAIAAAEGKCRIEPEVYQKKCKKSCDSCKYGIKDESCKDIHPNWTCDAYARRGLCKENKGYAYPFCASSCNTCDYFRNPPCEDTHESCETWSERGECITNHQWMSTHCAKSCGTCDRYKNGKCANLELDAFCEVQKENGNCDNKYKDTTRRNCRRTCGLCEAPPIPRDWECKDLAQSCEYWHKNGECESNPVALKAYCHKTCGHCKAK